MDPVCEPALNDLAIKYWEQCLPQKAAKWAAWLRDWVESLATGDATIGSYITAAVLAFFALSILAGIAGAALDIGVSGIDRFLERNPRVIGYIRTTIKALKIAFIIALPILMLATALALGTWRAIAVTGVIVLIYFAVVTLVYVGRRYGSKGEKKSR
jgi:hypothetical protein